MPDPSRQPGLPTQIAHGDAAASAPISRPMRPAKVWYVLAFLVPIAVALVVAGVVVLGSKPTAGPAPAALGGLKLLGVQTGSQAMSAVAGMHSGSFALEGAWIASYEGEATVWVGDAGDQSKAQQMVQAMYEAISRGGSPFSPPFVSQVGATPLFTTTDGRQLHYFYSTGRSVVWIAAPTSGETQFLRDAVEGLR